MFKRSDGYRTNCKPEDKETKESWLSEVDGNIHSSEEDFRGFEKVPTVVCKRFDVTPYLNKINYPQADTEVKMVSTENSDSVDINKLLLQCSVILVRDDLEKLKEMVKNKTFTDVSLNLKCKICSKIYTSQKKLQNHEEKKHMIVYKQNKTPKRVSFSDHIIVHEVKEYHRCRKCPRIFEDYNTLRLHMKQKHKKRRCYICFYCSKDFIDRTFFKVHIKLHCESCGLLLSNKKKYLEHRRYVCRIIKKYECKTCHMYFFNYMDLKDHSYDHVGTFFICDICKDQFETKCEVAHHIKFLHTKKSSNELYVKQVCGKNSVYTCNFCEKNFIKHETIQKHVSILPNLQNRVMTSYEDYCFCDQCLKKFTTESDMLQHKWSHFLKTSDNSQLRKESQSNQPIKMTYKVDEKLPDYFQPKLILDRVDLPVDKKKQKISMNLSYLDTKGMLKKPVVDPITKKTIISKYKCEKCGKYLSTNYCLNRHLLTVHGFKRDTNAFQCPICEEVFAWPWLLQSHNCIRMTIPEIDSKEADFENNDNSYAYDVGDNEDFTNSDIEIPAPIVQLTEFDHLNIVVNGGNGQLDVIDKNYPLNNIGYKVIVQEIPIEF